MKKLLTLLIIFTLIFTACTPSEPDSPGQEDKAPGGDVQQPQEDTIQPEDTKDPEEEPQTEDETISVPDSPIQVGVMRGPTAMGMTKLITDSEKGEAALNYEFSLDTIDSIVPKITTGELDIAAVPANISSVLYNNTEGKVQLVAINTLGVLYVMEKGESIDRVADLAGRTIYATGKGATPEYALRYVLTQNGIDPDSDVTIEYKSEAAEIIPLLAQSEDGIAILPQPFATAALNNVEGLRTALDWTRAWDLAADGSSSMITGVLVVRTEFLENYPEAVSRFLQEYADSTAYVNANPAEAAVWIEELGIVAAAIGEKAIPLCHIVCITGEEMQHLTSGYLQVLFDENPQSVGGTLPDEGFYWVP